MPEKRQLAKLNVLIYLLCLCISLILWTIQTLNRNHEFWFRVQFMDASQTLTNDSVPQTLVHLSGPGFLLVPFWLKEKIKPLRIDCPKDAWRKLPQGKALIHPTALILEQFPAETVLHEMKPDTIYFP